ncbi:MAG: polyprenyl synthetase family protein [Oscillospiraceae bacterium]|nr:polyprenyl synthetase family protein [Oscillospiraceae bacterium]
MTHNERFLDYQTEINAALDAAIPHSECLYSKVFDSMRYSLNAGGKRLRPLFVLEFSKMFGVFREDAMPFAVALEMIHTYSLIHDDLPCMDDDDLRRGKPTNHKKFGEATAVLAGDALLNRAFEHILTHSKFSSDITLDALKCLSEASGADGMIGGQIIDMEGEERALDIDEIKALQNLKTGALFKASVLIGCILGKASEEMSEKAEKFAEKLGLAFQIKDDLLNVEGSAELMGKDVGNDERSGKSTFVKLLGIDECKKMVVSLTEEAISSVRELPGSDFVVWLANELISREN